MTTIDWPDFYFARHGETDWNRERRYQGTIDVPLNAVGRAQADATGRLLAELFARDGVDPAGVDWFVSPLSRAVDTMERMRAPFGAGLPPVRVDRRLIEISFGHLEGLLHSELSEELAIAPGRRDASYWSFRPDRGENYDDLSARLFDFSRELTPNAVVVAHGGVLRALRHLVAGVPRGEVVNWPAPQGAIAHFTGGRMVVHTATDSWNGL